MSRLVAWLDRWDRFVSRAKEQVAAAEHDVADGVETAILDEKSMLHDLSRGEDGEDGQ